MLPHTAFAGLRGVVALLELMQQKFKISQQQRAFFNQNFRVFKEDK